MGPEVVLLILVISIGVILASILIPVSIYNNKYRNFVLKHSSAIMTLNEINERYHFAVVKNQMMTNSYDNENYYGNISPKDYLTYQLIYMQKTILKKINDADSNKVKLEKYEKEVVEKCLFNSFDTDQLPKNLKKLQKTEKKVFKKLILTPRTSFLLIIRLELTTLRGHHICSKEQKFDIKTIKSLIGRVNNKVGGFYQDREIWDSITRVERGKVSNRLRFRVYARDGHRCVKCGSTRNLEIDHIIPIAKGGKTTINNLQTLCHRCNMKKGTDIEYYRY